MSFCAHTPWHNLNAEVRKRCPLHPAIDACINELMGCLTHACRVSTHVGFQSAGVHRLDLGHEIYHAGQEQSYTVLQAKQQRSSSAGSRSHGDQNPQTAGTAQSIQHGQLKPDRAVTSDAQHSSAAAADGKRMSFQERHQREQQELQQQGVTAAWPQPRISADNVGYSLLKRAGWQEGTGLGVNEQGRVAPIQPWLQKGNRGIGFDHKAAQAQQAKQQGKGNEEKAAMKRARAAAERAVGDKRHGLIDNIVAAELAGEDLDTKVKKHQAVLHQEAEDAKRRAISRLLSNALNDPFDNPFSSGDSNPLGRKHRLTALNPLLDDDD